jgi:hypothetical protein
VENAKREALSLAQRREERLPDQGAHQTEPGRIGLTTGRILFDWNDCCGSRHRSLDRWADAGDYSVFARQMVRLNE